MIPEFENLFSNTHKEGSGSTVHQESAKKPESHTSSDTSNPKKEEHSGGLFGFSLNNVFSNIKDDALGIIGDISKKSSSVADAASKSLPSLSFEGLNLKMIENPVEKAADWVWNDDPFTNKPKDATNSGNDTTNGGSSNSSDGTTDGSSDGTKTGDNKSSGGFGGFLGDFLSKGTHVTKAFDSLFSNLFSTDQPGDKTVSGHDSAGETKTTIGNGVIKHTSAGDQTAVTADGVVSKDDKGNIAWFDKARHMLGETGAKGTQVKEVNGQLQFSFKGNEVDWNGKSLVLHEPDGTTKQITNQQVLTQFDSLLSKYKTVEAERARRFIQHRGESASDNPMTSAQNGVSSYKNAVTSKDETGTATAYTDGRLELIVNGKDGKQHLHVWVQANHEDMKVQLADGKIAYLHYDASKNAWEAARGQHIDIKHERDGSLVIDGQKIGTNQGGSVQIGDHTIDKNGSIENQYGVKVTAANGQATATEVSGTPGEKSHVMTVGKDGVSTLCNPDGGCTKVDGKTGSMAELNKDGVAIVSQKGNEGSPTIQTPDGTVTLGGTEGHPTAKLWNGDQFTANGDLKRHDGTTLHKDGSVDFADGTHIDQNGNVSQNGQYLGSLSGSGGRADTESISGTVQSVSSQIASLAASLAGKSGADLAASKAQLASLAGELDGLRGTAISAGDTTDVLKIDSTEGTISSLLGKATAAQADG